MYFSNVVQHTWKDLTLHPMGLQMEEYTCHVTCDNCIEQQRHEKIRKRHLAQSLHSKNQTIPLALESFVCIIGEFTAWHELPFSLYLAYDL